MMDLVDISTDVGGSYIVLYDSSVVNHKMPEKVALKIKIMINSCDSDKGEKYTEV